MKPVEAHDALGDDKLLTHLGALTPFDAVVCWLIGGHGAMRFNEAVDFSDIDGPPDYRLLVRTQSTSWPICC